MQSNDESFVVDEQVHAAFCNRIMQNALFHHVGDGIHPIHAHSLAALGHFGEIVPPEVPPGISSILRDSNHPARIPGPRGPITFFREGEGVTAIEVDAMLLHPSHEVRCSALEFFRGGFSDNWLTPETANQIEALSEKLKADDLDTWREAGIDLIPLLREDLFLHLAGLEQSFAHRFQEGVNTHLEFLMRPSFRALQLLRPPLYCPSEQKGDLTKWIEELAALPSIDLALSAYHERCGYVPLCYEFSAARLLRDWLTQHDATGSQCWTEVWDWAQNANSPLAKFHAVSIGMRVPEAKPDNSQLFWTEAVEILGVREQEKSQSDSMWQLYCELASHFARQIESLHPGQHGERVACYAWWLTDRVARILATTEEQAKTMLLRVVEPESEISFSKWLIARSPVVPSSFRYATLYLSSVWAMSLLAQLSNPKNQLDIESAPSESARHVADIFRGYLFSSPLADIHEVSEPVFAYEENASIGDFCQRAIPSDEQEAFRQVVLFRHQLCDVSELGSRLLEIETASPMEQHLTVLFLKDAVFSSPRVDEAVANWVDKTREIVGCLQLLPVHVVEPLLEVLAEFHVRQDGDMIVRIPHLLTYALEQSSDEQRAKRLFLSVFFMCISGGVASPIQRALTTEWRSSLVEVARASRENATHMARFSEAWVAGRIRSTSAAISRLVGPRDYCGSPDVGKVEVHDEA